MEKSENIADSLRSDICDADYVLIGIGEELQFDWNKMADDKRYSDLADSSENNDILQFFQKLIIERAHSEIIDKAYDNLLSLLDGKNYFIVSTLIDDIIYNHDFDHARIVSPCGGFRALQCSCSKEHPICDIPDGYMKKISDYYDGNVLIRPEILKCSECGAPLMMNQIGTQYYNEKGYLDQWKTYLAWLQGTINHNVCVIEFGEGLRFPTVIRMPFEKIALYNLKSRFYRINEKLYQINHDAAQRSTAVQCNALEFLCSMLSGEDQ